jgi:hypothetical protein
MLTDFWDTLRTTKCTKVNFELTASLAIQTEATDRELS